MTAVCTNIEVRREAACMHAAIAAQKMTEIIAANTSTSISFLLQSCQIPPPSKYKRRPPSRSVSLFNLPAFSAQQRSKQGKRAILIVYSEAVFEVHLVEKQTLLLPHTLSFRLDAKELRPA